MGAPGHRRLNALFRLNTLVERLLIDKNIIEEGAIKMPWAEAGANFFAHAGHATRWLCN